MKNYYYFCLYVLTGFAFCACNTNPYYNPDHLIVAEDTSAMDTLNGKKLIHQFGTVSKLYFSDSYLIALTAQSTHFFEICRPEYDTCMIYFGEYGHSKNEFVNAPYEIFIRKSSDTHELYLADENARITKIIDLDQSIKIGKAVVKKVVKRPNHLSGFEYHFIYRNEKDFAYYKELSYKDARDNIFYPPCYVFGNQGEDIERDVYPSIIPVKDYDILSVAYAGELEVSPNLSKCVLVHRFIDIIDIVDLENKKVVGVMGKDSYDFNYFSTIEDASLLTKAVKAYNINASVTDDYIFQLKSDLSILEMLEIEENDEIPYTSTVIVSNWDGHILHKFIINDVLRAIAYDEKNKFLYGVDNNGALFKYNVSSYL